MTTTAQSLSTALRWRRPSRRVARGFTFVELLIVVFALAILAFFVVPRFTSAHQQVRENTLKEELQYIRNQVMVFKAQHQDVPPGYPRGDPAVFPSAGALAAQMTHYSDINCIAGTQCSARFAYGPYFSQMPVNPVNGLNTFQMVGNNRHMPQPDGTTGWIYCPQTQEVVPNLVGSDNSGIPYLSY